MTNQKFGQWIRSDERRPALGDEVLGFDSSIKRIDVVSLETMAGPGTLVWEDCYGYWTSFEAINFWMPLPKPPEV